MDAERSGQWYMPGSEESRTQHLAPYNLTREFNALGNTDPARAADLLSQMFAPGSATPEIWGPLHLEYGVNTTFGEGCFMNFNCVILDIATITIGEGTLLTAVCIRGILA
ncbi:hypothetical protein A0K93_06680 [Corynebacterium sp. BCW_4722]|nr:hypothetical protein A0K93_06680 [Corynebacterium sp. BCW_4722]